MTDCFPSRQTVKTAEAFLKADGRELHQELVAKDKRNKHTSYIAGQRLIPADFV